MGDERDNQHLKISFRLAPRSCSFLPSRQQVRQLTRRSGENSLWIRLPGGLCCNY